MRTPYRTLITAAALLLVFPMPAQAQHRRSGIREVSRNYRDGAWFAFGIGRGEESYRFTDVPDNYSTEVSAPTLSLRLGGTPSQHWTLGGELFAWFHDLPDRSSETLGSAMFIAQFYPASRAGLFLKGGAGFAGAYMETEVSPNVVITGEEGGFATVLGVGYDIRVGRNVSITPTLDWHHQFYDRSDVRERIVSLGVGVTFH
ncbi:MAG: hypothetical protein AB7I33_01895 [Gemmatimonadales bacterium]